MPTLPGIAPPALPKRKEMEMPRRTRSQFVDGWAEQYEQYLRECSLIRLGAVLRREWRDRQDNPAEADHRAPSHKHAA
jgi:hypothetical protein